jgi:hypothetical protein
MYVFYRSRGILATNVNWNENNPTKKGGEKCDPI